MKSLSGVSNLMFLLLVLIVFIFISMQVGAQNESNESIQRNESITEMNLTVEIPEKTLKNLDIKVEYPENITRGEDFSLKAVVINNNSLTIRNVVLKWKLPDSFEIISGNQIEYCKDLDTNDSCFSNISIKTDLSTVLGKNEIKIVVNYEA